ncbi:hypothetical protein BJ508DRAFT_313144 [Ascobolus immersus RN42]|uniref:Uncharacterized protein n=1 Tax=Ascobolus immersus RN42 TaxID=1160509 RepID=A0A3N4HJV4_ASCIM|nr:hypothetical protein BJ508DRAFT_313144 [Ascobolus immersus RN42]
MVRLSSLTIIKACKTPTPQPRTDIAQSSKATHNSALNHGSGTEPIIAKTPSSDTLYHHLYKAIEPSAIMSPAGSSNSATSHPYCSNCSTNTLPTFAYTSRYWPERMLRSFGDALYLREDSIRMHITNEEAREAVEQERDDLGKLAKSMERHPCEQAPDCRPYFPRKWKAEWDIAYWKSSRRYWPSEVEWLDHFLLSFAWAIENRENSIRESILREEYNTNAFEPDKATMEDILASTTDPEEVSVEDQDYAAWLDKRFCWGLGGCSILPDGRIEWWDDFYGINDEAVSIRREAEWEELENFSRMCEMVNKMKFS